MLTRLCLLSSVSAIGMTIGAILTSTVTVQANPSIATSSNTMSAKASIVDRTAKPRLDLTSSIASEPSVATVSGTSELELVEHLVARNVQFYGAHSCSHCQKQKSLFGAVAAAKLPYVECAADGAKSQRKLCKIMNIQMFPTWVIDGKYFTGTKDLQEIAKMTGYQGSMNFKYRK